MPANHRPTISTATAEELAQALSPEPRCKYCHAPFKQKRPWQEFCSTPHRLKYHAEGKEAEVRMLRAELAQLREELAKLKGD